MTDTPMIDLIASLPKDLGHQTALDHGFVEVIDCMPRLSPTGNGDYAIAEMARTSYQTGTKTVREDAALVRYLVEHKHTSPLEGCELKLRVKCPIFVARQLVRHRTFSMNEMSARYSEMVDEFYIPSVWNVNTSTNKQATVQATFKDETIEEMSRLIKRNGIDCHDLYQVLLKEGLSREQARCVLPVNIYTMFVWKADLNNLLKMLTLRLDKHAQMECRLYAEAIARIVAHLWPAAWEAHKNTAIDGVTFTGEEISVLRHIVQFGVYTYPDTWSQRRKEEFTSKLGIPTT